MPTLNRRGLLRTITLGTGLSVFGCVSSTTPSGGGTPNSTSTRTNTTEERTQVSPPIKDGEASPPPSCPNEYNPMDPYWIVEGPGPLGGFDLSLADREIRHGDSLNATLKNLTDKKKYCGIKEKYDIQYKTKSGWQTIFGLKADMAVHPDIAAIHKPGEGFSWDLEFTREGLSGAVGSEVTYYVCAPLDPGTYRFVYWGITSEREVESNYETEYAIGVPFTVSQD